MSLVDNLELNKYFCQFHSQVPLHQAVNNNKENCDFTMKYCGEFNEMRFYQWPILHGNFRLDHCEVLVPLLPKVPPLSTLKHYVIIIIISLNIYFLSSWAVGLSIKPFSVFAQDFQDVSLANFTTHFKWWP